MRTHARSCTIAVTVSFLVSIAGGVLAAESVGNMKRIIVPEKGPPQTTIAPNGNSGGANGSAQSKGIANPAAGGVNVPAMIQGGVKKGGPLPIR